MWTIVVLLYNSNVGWHGMRGAVRLAELAIVDGIGGLFNRKDVVHVGG